MISAEELKAATGIVAAGQPVWDAQSSGCSWIGSNDTGVSIDIYPPGSSYEYAEIRETWENYSENKAEELPEVGEKGWVVRSKRPGVPRTILGAGKGDFFIDVHIIGNPDAAASGKEAVAVAKLVLGKIQV